MYHIVHTIYKKLINNSLTLQNEMPKMDQAFVSAVLIWRALLELAYIVQFDTRNYLYLIALIARPQLYHQFYDMDIIVCVICFLLLLNLFIILPYRKYTSTIILMFNTNLLNFCFEQSQHYLEYIAKTLLLIFLFWNIFILQGTLDAHVKNLEITKINILYILTNMLNVALMILQTQNMSNSLIMIMAYIASILQLGHHLYYNPYKIKNQLVIISSIYLITIYVGTLYVFELESKFSVQLILFPFFTRLLYTQIYTRTQGNDSTIDYILYNIEEKSNKEINFKDQLDSANDKIIYGSLLIINKAYFKALLYLQAMKFEQNTLITFKKQILEQKCSALLDSKVQSNLVSQNDLYVSVRQLMENEAQFHQVVEEMIDVLKQKIYTYQCLSDNSLNHFDQMYKYTTQLINLKQKLEEQYDKYPCDKNQNALGFLYAEIMYDYMGANKLYSIEALAEEKLKKKGIISDLFSSKMFYIISQFDNGNLNIMRLSNNAASSLSLTNDQLLNKNLEFLVPPGIRQWHRQLIDSAMEDGRSKYMRQLNQNYYIDKRDGLLQTIDFAIDISFVSDINFICFLQPSISQPMVIITDSQLNITCFSRELIRQIHCHPSTLVNQNLKSIIPNFKQDASYMDNVIANFVIDERSFSRSSSNITYITTIEIQKKKLKQQTIYYFIFFEYLRKKNNQESINVDDSPIMLCEDQDFLSKYSIKEDVTINVPFQETYQKHDTYLHNLHISDQKINQYSSSSKQVDVTGMRDDKEHTSLLFSPQQSVKKLVTQPLYFSKFYKQTISEKDSQDNKSKTKYQQIGFINEDKGIDDSASQVSSLQGMRKSKYFKKYEILRVLNELDSTSIFHKILVINFLLAISLQILLESVVQYLQLIFQQLSQININLTNLVSDIDLLQIKNLVYQPLESFLVTRWAIFDYNLLRLANVITLEQYQEYGVYPRSNLALGYDSLADNIYSVQNRQELQSFLQNTFLEVELYIDSNIGQTYNVTLRNAINILLNYQYTFKMVYIIDGVAAIDSPYIYFSYRNYLVLKKVFSQLNEDVLIQTINRAQQMEFSMIVLFIITICLLVLFFTLTYISTRKVFGLFERYLNIIQGSEKSSFEHDIFILGLFLDKLKKDPGILFKYTFKFDKNEEIITQLGERLHPQDINRKFKLKQKTISSKSWAAFYFIIAIIICFNSFFTFASIYSYLKLYPNTSRYYKQLSDVGTDIPTMFAQREILYNRNLFPYFSQQEFELILKQITDGLERTKQYTVTELDFSKYLLSNEFINYYTNIEKGDLCLQLPENIYERSQAICQITMSGNLKRGLKTSLIYIINTIQTEMDINKFTQRDIPVGLQLEGAFQLSELIKLMNKKFNQDLNKETLSLLQKTTIVNVIILTLLAFTLIFIVYKFKIIFASKYYIVQRFLYLTPKKTLLFDDSFERQIRSVLISDRKQ